MYPLAISDVSLFTKTYKEGNTQILTCLGHLTYFNQPLSGEPMTRINKKMCSYYLLHSTLVYRTTAVQLFAQRIFLHYPYFCLLKFFLVPIILSQWHSLTLSHISSLLLTSPIFFNTPQGLWSPLFLCLTALLMFYLPKS